MKKIVEAFKVMKRTGVIVDWALGGGVAVRYYVNPPATKDVDIFIIPLPSVSLSFMQPVFAYLLSKGAEFVGHKLKYDGVILDVIPVKPNSLEEEAVAFAVWKTVEGVRIRIMKAEYLAAIAMSVRRPKDVDRVNLMHEMLDWEFMNKLYDKYKK